MIYDKVYLVPTWVICDETPYKERVVNYFVERGGREFKSPAPEFEEVLLSFKKQGWHNTFHQKNKYNDGWIIPEQLLLAAVNQFVKQKMTLAARLEILAPHKIDRFYQDGADAERMINDAFLAADPISVSRALQIKENCHDLNKKNRPQLWISQPPYDRRLVERFGEKVVSIGEGEGYDINLLKAEPQAAKQAKSNKKTGNKNNKNIQEGGEKEEELQDLNIEKLIEQYFTEQQNKQKRQ